MLNEPNYPKPGATGEQFFLDLEVLNTHINHNKWAWFETLCLPESMRLEEDFHGPFQLADWIVNIQETTSGATVVQRYSSNLSVITDAGAGDYFEFLQADSPWGLFDRSDRLFFETRLSWNHNLPYVDPGEIWAGFVGRQFWGTSGYFGGGSPCYIIFRGTPPLARMRFEVYDGVSLVSIDTGFDVPADDFLRLFFHFDGEAIRWFIWDQTISPDINAAPVAAGRVDAGWMTWWPFHAGYGIRNVAGFIALMNNDYLRVAQKRRL